MSTKTTIQNLIDSNLASGSNITATEHRAVLTSVLNNLYPTPLVDTHLTTNVITAFGSNFEYELAFTKVGRLVHVVGSITNVSGLILDIQDIATITNAEFNPITTIIPVLQGHNSSGQTINIQVETGQLVLASTFGVATVFFINQSYPVIN
jgi:hypothetical protein